jgi:hypothetical protein
MVTISKFVLLVSMLLTILFALQFNEGRSIDFLNKVNVYVTNNITTHEVDVHCKEKNKDFGSKSLKFGQTYTFSFFPSFDFTPYFCKFSWINEIHYFEIYVESRDQGDCGVDCRWIIKESGLCKISNGTHCFPWFTSNVVIGGKKLDHTLNV